MENWGWAWLGSGGVRFNLLGKGRSVACGVPQPREASSMCEHRSLGAGNEAAGLVGLLP